MSSRGHSPEFSDDYSASSSRERHDRVIAEEDNPSNEEHDVDEKTSVDLGNQYVHQHSRMLSYSLIWSVTGRRGRKAKESSVSTTGFGHVRNSNEAESKDSNSTTILSNVMRDKGKSIIMTDETSKAEMIINNKLQDGNINLDLCLSIATGSNISTPCATSSISSGIGKATRRDKGKSIMDQENTEGNVKKVSEQVGDEKAHVCKLCSKSFSKHEALGGHMTSHSMRRPKAAKDAPAEGRQSGTARGDRVEGSNKLHECNVCHRVFDTGQQLGGHKRAHYEGSLGTCSSKRAKGNAHGSSSSSGTAVYEPRRVSSSESIVDKAASSSEAVEANTSAAAARSSAVLLWSAVLRIDLNKMPGDEE